MVARNLTRLKNSTPSCIKWFYYQAKNKRGDGETHEEGDEHLHKKRTNTHTRGWGRHMQKRGKHVQGGGDGTVTNKMGGGAEKCTKRTRKNVVSDLNVILDKLVMVGVKIVKTPTYNHMLTNPSQSVQTRAGIVSICCTKLPFATFMGTRGPEHFITKSNSTSVFSRISFKINMKISIKYNII